jgi:hypothetical protein
MACTAHFPHRLTAPQSEQNSAFWGYALIGVRKRSDSLTLHHAHHCLFLIPCLYGERLAKDEVRNDRRLGLGDDLGRSRNFRQPFVDSTATPFGFPRSGGMRPPVLGY